jgi:alkylhydroperoxidase family enzyme
MATVTPPADPESDPRVKAVFDDICATRKSDFINNVWRYLVFDPALLAETWAGVKAVMAAARAKRMTAEEQADLIRVVSQTSRTNAVLNAVRPPVDAVFLMDQPSA